MTASERPDDELKRRRRPQMPSDGKRRAPARGDKKRPRVATYRRREAEAAEAHAKERAAKLQAERERAGIAVDATKLAPHNSYGAPRFLARGCYVDIPFVCQKCGAKEVWTARQQKWWYEVAKGSIYTTAIKCRSCRKPRNEARRVHLEGLARKKNRPASEKPSRKRIKK